MNSKIRLSSKYLLSKNTIRLFFASFLSFLIRYSLIIFSILLEIFLFESDFTRELLAIYNSTLIYTLVTFISIGIIFLNLLIVSAIKLGESFIYFTRAQGSKGRALLLFKYLKPSSSLKAMALYLKLFWLKSAWLFYYLLPPTLTLSCAFYLYKRDFMALPVFYILFVGASVLLSISLVMFRLSKGRYGAAPYYICLDKTISVKDAINKSITFTDGFLSESVMLTYSFWGWFLLCILIVPLIYVIPYYKISKAKFATEVVFMKKKSTAKYPINLLHLSGEHIN